LRQANIIVFIVLPVVAPTVVLTLEFLASGAIPSPRKESGQSV
jgi:hypothetical protein